jgi:hypothetical protein
MLTFSIINLLFFHIGELFFFNIVLSQKPTSFSFEILSEFLYFELSNTQFQTNAFFLTKIAIILIRNIKRNKLINYMRKYGHIYQLEYKYGNVEKFFKNMI